MKLKKKFKIDFKNKKLAINGGSAVRKKKWPNNITTDNKEISAVTKVLRNGNLSLFEGSFNAEAPFSFNGGPNVCNLENKWRKYYNCNYAVSMNSATSCLYAAIGSLNIGYGDEVIVSPFTMTACATAPLIYGAIPVFADVEPNTGCIDPESFKKKISKRTKAIIVVHQFGIPANIRKILEIAKFNNIKVIEDCAQAHGAMFQGKFVGTFGDIGVFSLNVNKTIQSGEGGICITNSKELDFRLRLIRNHGEAVVDSAKYKKITNIVGFNYRMTELTAAVAIEQLKKLNKLNVYRIKLVNYFYNKIKKISFLETIIRRPECNVCNCKLKCKSVFYIFPIKFIKKYINISRKIFSQICINEGIRFYEGYTKPLYLQSIYQKKKLFKFNYPFSAKENFLCNKSYSKGTCPQAEKLFYEEILINEDIRFPNKKEDIDDIIKAINKIIEA
jgi:perosamine synthetase